MKKIIAVTGSTGGMGQILCNQLAQRGYQLAICSNEGEKLSEQKCALESIAPGLFAKEIDITSDLDVKNFFLEAREALGEIGILVNLAGLSIPAKIPEMDEDSFDLTMDVNVKGTYLASKYFAQQNQNGGLIINIGSMAARRVNANAPIYCVAKGAVNTFSQGLALQVASENIRVTTLNPGGADTGFWGNRAVNRQNLLRPEQVVNVMLYVIENDPNVVIHSIDFESFNAMK